MTLTYSETDTVGIANNFAVGGATGHGLGTTFDLVMQQGGGFGTATHKVSFDPATAICITYISPTNDPAITNWASGNWVVRLNVDPADTDGSIVWDSTGIFVVDSAGTTDKGTVGTLTGQAIAVSTSGTKTMTISGSALTQLNTDRIYIELVFINSAGVSHNFQFFANLNIDTPLVAAPVITAVSEPDFQWLGGDEY